MASDFPVELPLPRTRARRRRGSRCTGGCRRPRGVRHARPAARAHRPPRGGRDHRLERRRAGGGSERPREGVPLAAHLPRRRRLQAVAAPDRHQRGPQRPPRRAAARGARRPRSRAAPDPAAGADEAVVAREEVATVLRALAQLSDVDRLVVVLRYFAELPDDQAAALAGVSTGTYRVRLVRARRRLQALLEEADE